MKPKHDIQERLDGLKSDSRLSYPPAQVQINAPLALIQVDLKARVAELEWMLSEAEEVNGFKPGDNVLYIPSHAEGDPNHKDVEHGVIKRIKPDKTGAFVNYFRGGILQPTAQATHFRDLENQHINIYAV